MVKSLDDALGECGSDYREGQMNEAPRLFGPRIAKRKPVPKDTPTLAVDSLSEEVAHVTGKDSEIAELNAQRFGQVLKRALRRSKQSKGE